MPHQLAVSRPVRSRVTIEVQSGCKAVTCWGSEAPTFTGQLAVMGALPQLRIGRSSSKNLFDKRQCHPNFRPSRLPVDGTKARIFAPQFCERFFCFLREGLRERRDAIGAGIKVI